MVTVNLLFVFDKLTPLLGIARDIGNRDRELNLQVDLHRCWQDKVVAEDLLFLIGVFRVTADPDPGIGVCGEFGTSDGHWAIMKAHIANIRSERVDAKMLPVEFFFDSEECGSISLLLSELSIRKGKPKGKEFNLRFFHLLRKTLRRTVCIDTDLGAEVIVWEVIEAIKDPVLHLANDIFDRDPCTLIAEIGTSFISCPGWVQGSIMGQDLKGNHLELMEEVHQHMEDFIIEPFPEADTEIGEGPLRRDMAHRDASGGPVRAASVFIMERFKELTHVLMTINIPKEVQQKEADRIIAGRTIGGITISH
jgi:hypothetical protein